MPSQSAEIWLLLMCCFHYPQHMVSATWSKITTEAPAHVGAFQSMHHAETSSHWPQPITRPTLLQRKVGNVRLIGTIMDPAKKSRGAKRGIMDVEGEVTVLPHSPMRPSQDLHYVQFLLPVALISPL